MSFYSEKSKLNQSILYIPPTNLRKSYTEADKNERDRDKSFSRITTVKPYELSKNAAKHEFVSKIPKQQKFVDDVQAGPSTSTVNFNNNTHNFRDANKNVKEVAKQGNKQQENVQDTMRISGMSLSEQLFIFTGNVERIIRWHKIFLNHLCYYEVIANVVSLQEGTIRTQRIMLLRDKKGPILQVIYYDTTYLNIEEFHIGQVLRCVGRMNGPNSLFAFSIRAATSDEIDTLQRYCCICERSISRFLALV